MAFGPINLGGAGAGRRRGCRRGDPPPRAAACSRWSRSSWAPGSARSPSGSPTPVVDRLRRPAGLPAPERAGPCRAAGARHARRRAGRLPVGAGASLRGRRRRPLNTLVRTLKAIGCRALLLTNASGSLRPELGPGLAGADRGPHQPAGHQPAGRAQRRRGRPALRRPDRGLRARACARRSTPPPQPAGSRSAAASTSPCSAPPSRRRPRSAPTARWAPIWSACRPCPRRSARAMPGWRWPRSRS